MANTFILRAHRRSKTRCVMHYLGPHVSGTGIVQDVSLAGWRVVGAQRITQGDILSLRIFLPLVPAPIQIESASVQWVKGREFGLSMIKISPSVEAAIKTFVQTMAEPIYPHDYSGSKSNG